MQLISDPRILLLAALVCIGCRQDVGDLDAGANLPHDGFVSDGAEDGPPLTYCPGIAACIACCTGENESGALDFTSFLQSCACQPAVCASACAKTLCGSALIIDAPCRTCLDGARAVGGACHQDDADCQSDVGPCGAFEDCMDSCPR
jgi:hypothetical protein